MPKISKNLSHTALDLFSGCGGLSLGLKRAGFNVLAAIEIDAKAQETYQINHPDVELIMKDIQKVAARTLMRRLGLKAGELDLLAGCPPCQGFSRMRTKNKHTSTEDPRNDLIFEFLRFIRAFKPKSVMLENVPALKDDQRFIRFLMGMRALGYRGEPVIQDAAKFGVPQRRKRLIYLAVRGKNKLLKDPINKEYPAKTVRDVIGAMKIAGSSGDPLHDMPEHRQQKTMELIRAIPKNGGSRSDLPTKYRLACHESTDGFKDVYGRMAWDAPAPTITGGCSNPSKGRFIHPIHNRAITLREAALLQGFPMSYKFKSEHGKQAVALMIGNALPPPFIEAHAKTIADIIQEFHEK
jgi:DNA (cytosine-5)-methyltransferase 1